MNQKITPKNVVALAGGVGGAKLAHGLAQIVPPENLTIIVNTADDFEHLSLHISPDLDTVLYTLAGLANPKTGWGLAGESWATMAGLARYGGPTWFQVGDRDLATHLLRTMWLRQGYPLTWVTGELCRRLGVRPTMLPMADEPVRTMVQTAAGELAFQEYFVEKQWQPVVQSIRFAGIEAAQPTKEVVSVIRTADVLVLCPSNPLVSLDPILAVPSMRRIVAASRAPKIAVSPIVGGQALKGPAAKLMAELGLEVSAAGVARYLREVLTGFVLDTVDAGQQAAIEGMGLKTLVTNTVMLSDEERAQLARELLQFAQTT